MIGWYLYDANNLVGTIMSMMIVGTMWMLIDGLVDCYIVMDGIVKTLMPSAAEAS